MPGNKLGNREGGDFLRTLLDDQVVDRSEVGGGEAQFGEQQINAIHPKGEFALEFRQVSLLQTRAITDDETTLPFMKIVILAHSSAALSSPGMQIGIWNLWETAKRVVGIFRKLNKGEWKNGFESLH
jgi:hypothetical protein